MFTGIVEETGIVERIKTAANSIQLTVRAKVCARGLKVGDSLAVNGCCLTVTKISSRGKAKLAQFDLLRETWRRTNLQFSKPGSLVNLERPLAAGGRIGGQTQKLEIIFVFDQLKVAVKRFEHPLGVFVSL